MQYSPKPGSKRSANPFLRASTHDYHRRCIGYRAKVPTLDKPIMVKVPPSTQNDQVLRLRGKSLPYYEGSSKGDLKIRILIRIPNDIGKEQRNLFEQLRVLDKDHIHVLNQHWK